MADRLPQGPFRNCMEWFEVVNPLLDPEQFIFLMVLLWNVWNRRNRWLHSNQLVPARLVSEYAQIVHGGFQQNNEDVVTQVACVREKNWSKPEQGQIKINVDGAWKATTRTAAIGVIARDHHESHDALHAHPGFTVQHVAREANQAAHGLAQHCVNSLVDFSFVFDVPECISQVLIHDAIFSD
ncbi:hypothetical protein V6N11_024177 [Hibiscus sabdariffa]|uniref:RNase H type-1 domain-containing protein n=1 Tax=Hibiscus sabdariffa TaxID=183260 RepID=A0ABR1Z9X2_9ROSI